MDSRETLELPKEEKSDGLSPEWSSLKMLGQIPSRHLMEEAATWQVGSNKDPEPR